MSARSTRPVVVADVLGRGPPAELPTFDVKGNPDDERRVRPGRVEGRLGSYWVHEFLAEGGMGRVFVATRDGEGEWAIKFPCVSESAEEQAKLLRWASTEGKNAEKLGNIHGVVPVVEVGFHAGTTFIVMPRLHGATLNAFVARGDERLSQAQVLYCMIEVADALRSLHDFSGLSHRDLKPMNVFVKLDGHLVLMDFGLARSVDQTGSVRNMGTNGFCPPQEEHTPMYDIYSFGATFCAVLTGRAPACPLGEGDRHARLREFGPLLAPVIERCLQESPQHRYPSATDLVNDLNQLRTLLPDTPSPPQFGQLVQKKAQRERAEREEEWARRKALREQWSSERAKVDREALSEPRESEPPSDDLAKAPQQRPPGWRASASSVFSGTLKALTQVGRPGIPRTAMGAVLTLALGSVLVTRWDGDLLARYMAQAMLASEREDAPPGGDVSEAVEGGVALVPSTATVDEDGVSRVDSTEKASGTPGASPPLAGQIDADEVNVLPPAGGEEPVAAAERRPSTSGLVSTPSSTAPSASVNVARVTAPAVPAPEDKPSGSSRSSAGNLPYLPSYLRPGGAATPAAAGTAPFGTPIQPTGARVQDTSFPSVFLGAPGFTIYSDASYGAALKECWTKAGEPSGQILFDVELVFDDSRRGGGVGRSLKICAGEGLCLGDGSGGRDPGPSTPRKFLSEVSNSTGSPSLSECVKQVFEAGCDMKSETYRFNFPRGGGLEQCQ